MKKNKDITLLEAIQTMNSEEFDDDLEGVEQYGVEPRTINSLSGYSELNQKIVDKLLSISGALANEFGFDQRAVLQDMVKDLRIAGGEQILDVIAGDSPIEEISKEMARAAQAIGMDSSIAIQALLKMDERQLVQMFRQFLNQNNGQLDYTRGRTSRRLGNRDGMQFLESFKHRVLLDEGLDDIYTKYYSDIKRPTFNRLIELDPTYNPDRDKLGTYGKWLLNAYRQKNLTERDFPRVREILDDFDDRKRYIVTPGGSDIGRYKTIDDVRASLSNIQLSQNQIQKQAKRGKFYADLGEEAEFIGETDEWEVWKPKTYQASCKLGEGTTWCTARPSNDYWYKEYTSRGTLYVFIHKTRTEDRKYQVHIKPDNSTGDFMDEKDLPTIPFDTFIVKENLADLFRATELKNVDALLEVDNLERLKNGEPYIYAGGRVKSKFTSVIKRVRFAPEFTDDAIPGGAFRGCEELEEVVLPETVKLIGSRAFEGCDKVVIYTPNLNMTVWPADREYMKGKIKHIRFR